MERCERWRLPGRRRGARELGLLVLAVTVVLVALRAMRVGC